MNLLFSINKEVFNFVIKNGIGDIPLSVLIGGTTASVISCLHIIGRGIFQHSNKALINRNR